MIRFGASARSLLGSDKAVRVVQNAITKTEEAALVAELDPILKRRRYQRDHWDNVIIGYKEVERAHWQDLSNEATVHRIKDQILSLMEDLETGQTGSEFGMGTGDGGIEWLPVHVIDLDADGIITPHVDSVKFSGDLVCGVSLLSPAIMTLRPDSPPEQANDPAYRVQIHLPPRSLYVLSGNARYHFAHSIDLQDEDTRGEYAAETEALNGNPSKKTESRSRRISLLFRDAKVLGD